MRVCWSCGEQADFYCLDCHIFACINDLINTRSVWGFDCGGRPDGHAFVPIIQNQNERGVRIMKATKPEEAKKEGKKFATLLSSLYQQRADASFENASAFAQYFAIDVMGYRDAEIANAWTSGFISVIMKTPTVDELTEQYSGGGISLEGFQRLIQKALQAPQEQPKEPRGKDFPVPE